MNNSNEDTVFDMLLRDQAQIKSKFGPNVAFGSCGDTNLHTGTEDDFVPGDINYEEDIPLKRFSKDPLCTSSGRVQLSYCQEGNFRILNGRVGKDKGVGEVTFSSHVGNKPSVIDYVMMSPDYMHNVTQFKVGSNYLLSDHYPILWSYKIAPSTDRDAKQTGEKPLRWSEEKKVAATLAIDGCMPRLSEILESSESLSTITEQFTNTLYEAVRPVLQLGAKQLTRARPGVVGEEPSDGDDITPRTRTSRPKQPWFCETCGVLRDAALAHLNKLRPNHEHELNKQRLESAKKKYNDHKKQCKLNYRISQTKHVFCP